MLKKIQFGRTGMSVSQLGYGSMGLRGPNTWGVRVVEDRQAERVLNAVLDAGINFIDTAPDYGIAEARIGKFLGRRRDEFYLATKCGCDPVQHADHLEIRHTWQPEVLQRNLEQSLRLLKTDHIDLMQFHGGQAETHKEQGLLDLALKWKDEGKVRFLGASSKLPDVPALLELDVFDVVQIPYSCLAPEHSAWLQKAADLGMGVIVRGGIAHGGPEADIQRPALNEVWDRARLEEIVPSGVSKAAFILRATISHPACHTTIVGTGNLVHLEENLQAVAEGPLPEELRAELTRRVEEVLEADG